MTVFSSRISAQLKESVIALGVKMFSHSPLMLTGDEFIAAMIDPDHVSKLKEVQELVGHFGNSSTSLTFAIDQAGGATIHLYVQFIGKPPIILPHYAKRLQPTCPDNIIGKINAWADERYRLGCMFGYAIDAIDYLNEECGDARAMKLMLPALVTIMASNSDWEEDRMVKRGKKLNEAKGFGSLPRLTPDQRQRLKDVSALINVAAMLKDNVFDIFDKSDEGNAVISANTQYKTSASLQGSTVRNAFNHHYVATFV